MKKIQSFLIFTVFTILLFGMTPFSDALSSSLSFGSEGSNDGQLNKASNIAIDSSGNLWVSDTKNDRIQKFDSSGTYQSQFGGKGDDEGQFKEPTGIAIDSSGNLWVSDSKNYRVQKFDILPPTVSSVATASTTSITLTMSESVTDSSATSGDFTVSGVSSNPTVSSISVSGSAVTLSLSSAMTDSETVLVSYTQSSGNIKDSAGNNLVNFSNQSITNNLDTTAPTLIETATITSTTINAVFSEDLDASSITTSDFTVASNTVSGVSESSGVITITLGTALSSGATPLVTITNGSINDVAGNPTSSEITSTPTDETATITSAPAVSDTTYTLDSNSGGSLIPISSSHSLSTLVLDSSISSPELKFDSTAFDTDTDTATLTNELTVDSTIADAVIPAGTTISASG